jgi:hypothetical protein
MKPATSPVLRSTRLLDQVRERIRYKHYSLRTQPDCLCGVHGFIQINPRHHALDALA